MNADHLVQMANRIGQFFESMPRQDEALDGVADHLRKFWTPSMRAEFLALLDSGERADIMPLVQAAVQRHRTQWLD
mgnify:CR=1 FL=1